MRVLIVEDDKTLAVQIEKSLREAGYAVDVAYDVEDGHFLGDPAPYGVVVSLVLIPI